MENKKLTLEIDLSAVNTICSALFDKYYETYKKYKKVVEETPLDLENRLIAMREDLEVLVDAMYYLIEPKTTFETVARHFFMEHYLEEINDLVNKAERKIKKIRKKQEEKEQEKMMDLNWLENSEIDSMF